MVGFIKIAALLCTLALWAPLAQAQQAESASEPQSLFELLEMVKGGLEVERVENIRRTESYERAKEDPPRLLEDGALLFVPAATRVEGFEEPHQWLIPWAPSM